MILSPRRLLTIATLALLTVVVPSRAEAQDKARIVVLAVWSSPTDPVTHQDLLEQTWEFLGGWQITSQRTVQQAEVQAQADRAIAVIRLYKAIGGGWPVAIPSPPNE